MRSALSMRCGALTTMMPVRLTVGGLVAIPISVSLFTDPDSASPVAAPSPVLAAPPATSPASSRARALEASLPRGKTPRRCQLRLRLPRTFSRSHPRDLPPAPSPCKGARSKPQAPPNSDDLARHRCNQVQPVFRTAHERLALKGAVALVRPIHHRRDGDRWPMRIISCVSQSHAWVSGCLRVECRGAHSHRCRSDIGS